MNIETGINTKEFPDPHLGRPGNIYTKKIPVPCSTEMISTRWKKQEWNELIAIKFTPRD